MNPDEVQEIASDHSLDVRIMTDDIHWRLMDEMGNYILDVYFKRRKNKSIAWNTIFIHKTKRWARITNGEELIKLIKANI